MILLPHENKFLPSEMETKTTTTTKKKSFRSKCRNQSKKKDALKLVFEFLIEINELWETS